MSDEKSPVENYMGREPDFEDEKIRMWSGVDKKEKEGKKIMDDCKDSPKIKLGEVELSMVGFSTALNKKTGKPIFYYKVKKNPGEDKMMFIYYLVEENASKDDEEKLHAAIKEFEKIGLEIHDAREFFPNAMKQMMTEISKKKTESKKKEEK